MSTISPFLHDLPCERYCARGRAGTLTESEPFGRLQPARTVSVPRVQNYEYQGARFTRRLSTRLSNRTCANLDKDRLDTDRNLSVKQCTLSPPMSSNHPLEIYPSLPSVCTDCHRIVEKPLPVLPEPCTDKTVERSQVYAYALASSLPSSNAMPIVLTDEADHGVIGDGHSEFPASEQSASHDTRSLVANGSTSAHPSLQPGDLMHLKTKGPRHHLYGRLASYHSADYTTTAQHESST